MKKNISAIMLSGLMLFLLLKVHAQQFEIIDGIPHFPIVDSTDDVVSPETGTIVINAGDEFNIVIYNGSTWKSIYEVAGDVTGTGTTFSIKNSLAAIPVGDYSALSPDVGSTYFSDTEKAFMVYDGTSFKKLSEITALAETAGTGVSHQGRFFKFPVVATPPASIENGGIYLKPDGNIKLQNDLCPTTITRGAITYEVVKANGRCWLARNLGATAQATSLADGNPDAIGSAYQFNLTSGQNIDENKHWEPDKDPCTQNLGADWSLPTASEWSSFYGSVGYSKDAAFNVLKLHYNGRYLRGWVSVGTEGYWWSSTQVEPKRGQSTNIAIHISSIRASSESKENSMPVRCIKD